MLQTRISFPNSYVKLLEHSSQAIKNSFLVTNKYLKYLEPIIRIYFPYVSKIVILLIFVFRFLAFR